jgi:hypothetical protein
MCMRARARVRERGKSREAVLLPPFSQCGHLCNYDFIFMGINYTGYLAVSLYGILIQGLVDIMVTPGCGRRHLLSLSLLPSLFILFALSFLEKKSKKQNKDENEEEREAGGCCGVGRAERGAWSVECEAWSEETGERRVERGERREERGERRERRPLAHLYLQRRYFMAVFCVRFFTFSWLRGNPFLCRSNVLRCY